MLKDTLLNRVFIRSYILLLRAIAPTSILYCCARLAGVLASRNVFVRFLDVYAVSESLSYLAIYLPRRWIFNRPAQIVNPLPSRSQRREMFIKSWGATWDARIYLSNWFYKAPLETLHREDVKDFILWRLWNRLRRDKDDGAELAEYLAYMEDVLIGNLPQAGRAPSL